MEKKERKYTLVHDRLLFLCEINYNCLHWNLMKKSLIYWVCFSIFIIICVNRVVCMFKNNSKNQKNFFWTSRSFNLRIRKSRAGNFKITSTLFYVEFPQYVNQIFKSSLQFFNTYIHMRKLETIILNFLYNM